MAAAAAGLIGGPPIEMLPAALRARDMLALVGGSAEAALDRLGPLREALAIDGLVDRVVGTCSVGMRQRIAIACAFAGGRDVVVLDEPFNWLDPVAAYDVRMALRNMVVGGMLLVTALHDLATLVAASDRGMLLSAGQVALALGEPELADARHDPGAFERRMIAALRGS